MNSRKLINSSVLACLLALGACGGDDDNEGPTDNVITSDNTQAGSSGAAGSSDAGTGGADAQASAGAGAGGSTEGTAGAGSTELAPGICLESFDNSRIEGFTGTLPPLN